MMFKVQDLKIRRSTWVRSAGLPQHLLGWEFEDCSSVPEAIMGRVEKWLWTVQNGQIINRY